MGIKNIFKTVLFVVVFSLPLSALTDSEIFLKANESYKTGNFEEAYNLYQKISDKNSSIYYNLGNCAYKLSKFGYALLYWRKAENEWGIFNREELINNIRLVKATLKSQSLGTAYNKENNFEQLIKRIKNVGFSFMRAAPLFYFQLLFLIVWILLFLHIKYLYKKHKKFIIVILFILVALCGSMLALKYGMSVRQYGVVVQSQAQLLSGPGSTYQVLITLPEGKEGFVYFEASGFYKAKINGVIGWIKRGEFEKI